MEKCREDEYQLKVIDVLQLNGLCIFFGRTVYFKNIATRSTTSV